MAVRSTLDGRGGRDAAGGRASGLDECIFALRGRGQRRARRGRRAAQQGQMAQAARRVRLTRAHCRIGAEVPALVQHVGTVQQCDWMKSSHQISRGNQSHGHRWSREGRERQAGSRAASTSAAAQAQTGIRRGGGEAETPSGRERLEVGGWQGHSLSSRLIEAQQLSSPGFPAALLSGQLGFDCRRSQPGAAWSAPRTHARTPSLRLRFFVAQAWRSNCPHCGLLHSCFVCVVQGPLYAPRTCGGTHRTAPIVLQERGRVGRKKCGRPKSSPWRAVCRLPSLPHARNLLALALLFASSKLAPPSPLTALLQEQSQDLARLSSLATCCRLGCDSQQSGPWHLHPQAKCSLDRIPSRCHVQCTPCLIPTAYTCAVALRPELPKNTLLCRRVTPH